MATRLHILPEPPTPVAEAAIQAAIAYDAVGEDYFTYADGDGRALYDFTSRYSYADRQIWQQIDAALHQIRASGRRDISLLDAGCGPGTWLLRTVRRAHHLGLHVRQARGFDISPEMIRIARENTAFQGDFHFEVGDLQLALPEADASVDLTLCLYGVLNHLPATTHAAAAKELARVTCGHLFTTVRTVGSLPTIYVDAVEKARSFLQDHEIDQFDADLDDGRHISFTSHLFCAAEFRALFEGHVQAMELTGLDLFHSRFSANPRWNPAKLPYADAFEQALCKLEERCCCDPAFMDRAAHILLHARCAG
ncbi:class I SAM-dependent methyltransferase [Sphingobium sp.]|uniref:class I SAM-dependent methyltransferase n=1 Tax=Sphingobium sp. TaxID=1912891 RepID=UPI003B3AC587